MAVLVPRFPSGWRDWSASLSLPSPPGSSCYSHSPGHPFSPVRAVSPCAGTPGSPVLSAHTCLTSCCVPVLSCPVVSLSPEPSTEAVLLLAVAPGSLCSPQLTSTGNHHPMGCLGKSPFTFLDLGFLSPCPLSSLSPFSRLLAQRKMASAISTAL